jgi:hypothetical protein
MQEPEYASPGGARHGGRRHRDPDRICEVNRHSACSYQQEFAQSRSLALVRTLAMMHISAAPMAMGVRGMCAYSPIGWEINGSAGRPRTRCRPKVCLGVTVGGRAERSQESNEHRPGAAGCEEFRAGSGSSTRNRRRCELWSWSSDAVQSPTGCYLCHLLPAADSPLPCPALRGNRVSGDARQLTRTIERSPKTDTPPSLQLVCNTGEGVNEAGADELHRRDRRDCDQCGN